ncbi:MAG: hypothetical protein EP305_12460 [Bacteroidetes bacterium]|nr:MAG: hypothetical protein EP305_12460 [Bacteroidota bacterium]
MAKTLLMIRTLLLLYLTSSFILTAQDSLNVKDSPVDSIILTPPITVQLDSNWMYPISILPPYFPPPCILPGPYIPPFDWSQIVCTVSVFSPYNPDGALYDIKKKKVKLLFPGGFAGTPNLDSKAAKAFSKKYDVDLICQGCLRNEGDDEEGYNRLVFAYLDQLYGNAWRNELPEIPVGMEDPQTEMSKNEITQQKSKERNPVKPKVTAPKKASFPFISVFGTVLIAIGIFAVKRKMKTTE